MAYLKKKKLEGHSARALLQGLRIEGSRWEKWSAALLLAMGLTPSPLLGACSRAESIEAKHQALTAWTSGVSYSAGDEVSYEGVVYTAKQSHTSQSSWTPSGATSLWERQNSSAAPVGVGTIVGVPDLDQITLLHDCGSDPISCCSVGATVRSLGAGDDVFSSTAQNQCVLSQSGRDTIFLQASGSSSLFLGNGDDTAMDGPGDDLILGGDGRDTINGYGGTNLFFGGFGADVILAANGDNRVVPGPGADTVALGTGNDTVYIFDLCEVEAGDIIDGGSGDDTLISPVPLTVLVQLGVVISNIENVVVEQNPCRSECVGSPSTTTSCSTGTVAQEQQYCASSFCCRAGSTSASVEAGNASCTTSVECVVGSSQSDAIVARSSTETGFYDGREGDDVLRDGGHSAQMFGQDGSDVLCGRSSSLAVLGGGAGDDRIQSAGQDAAILPGGGRDLVRVDRGNARVFVLDICEVEPGDEFRLKAGTMKVFSPISRQELISRGVLVDDGVIVETWPGDRCSSDCSGHPVCAADEKCVDQGATMVCVPRSTAASITPRDLSTKFNDLPPDLAQILRQYIDEVGRGQHVVIAPVAVRHHAAAFSVSLRTSILAESNPTRRSTEIAGLGALSYAGALAGLESIAAQEMPAQIRTSGSHSGAEEAWYSGQAEAVEWIAVIGANGHPEGDATLLRLAQTGDRSVRELAGLGYLLENDTAERRATLGAHLPASSQYVLGLSYFE